MITILIIPMPIIMTMIPITTNPIIMTTIPIIPIPITTIVIATMVMMMESLVIVKRRLEGRIGLVIVMGAGRVAAAGEIISTIADKRKGSPHVWTSLSFGELEKKQTQFTLRQHILNGTINFC